MNLADRSAYVEDDQHSAIRPRRIDPSTLVSRRSESLARIQTKSPGGGTQRKERKSCYLLEPMISVPANTVGSPGSVPVAPKPPSGYGLYSLSCEISQYVRKRLNFPRVLYVNGPLPFRELRRFIPQQLRSADAKHVIVRTTARGLNVSTWRSSLFYLSFDSGATWSQTLEVPGSTDPACGFGADGMVYATTLNSARIRFVQSKDGGRTWQVSIQLGS